MSNNPWPFPVEALRHRYVTPFGGYSSDLYPGEIGVRLDALTRNTDLNPRRDEVLVSSELDGRRFPLFTREVFRVVALDDERPDALAHSPQGEAVFSCFEDPMLTRESIKSFLKPGSPVFLNAAMSRAFASDDATRALIERMLERRKGG